MTIKTVDRDTCPASWFVGYQMLWRNELIELVEINNNEYTWIDIMDEMLSTMIKTIGEWADATFCKDGSCSGVQGGL